MSTEIAIACQYIRGLAFPCSPHFTKANIESGFDYKPKDGDIIVSTFPKTGTTWLQYIIYEILNKGCPPPTMTELQNVTGFMDFNGADLAEKLEPPRSLKYHLPYNMVPMSPKAKYISIIRNPCDVVVSYYHFLKQITEVNLQFDDLFDAFVKGECIYGDYFDHVLFWYEHRNDDNVLLLSFEKMKKNPKKGLLLVAEFLGHDLDGSDELVDQILKYTNFDHMKRNLQCTKNKSDPTVESGDEEKSEVDFFRKGAVGDGKLLLTEAQAKTLKDRIEEKLKGSDVERLWS